MRTNIVIDDVLIKEGMKYTGIKTKTKLVDCALRELIERSKRKEILKLKGKLNWEGNLEEMRTQACLLTASHRVQICPSNLAS